MKTRVPKGTSMGCYLAPEMISMAEIVPLQLYAGNKHPTQGAVFWGLAKPLCRNFSWVYALPQHLTCVVSNMVKIAAGYVSEGLHCIGDKKTFWRFPTNFFYATVHCDPTFRFHLNLFRFESYDRTTLL